MKLGIMQPYFVPYIGYWQLMNLVDTYIFYDDVNYIKGGWINRNRIFNNPTPIYFNIPLIKASSNKKINEIQVNIHSPFINKNLRTIENIYHKAPYYSEVYPLIKEICLCNKNNLAEYIIKSISIIANYLDIHTNFIKSSELEKNNALHGEEKILDICNRLNANEYYNAIGGKSLYSFEHFNKHNIKLNFIKTNDIIYKQFNNIFYPNLSIIDIMMFNNKKTISNMLLDYTLINQ